MKENVVDGFTDGVLNTVLKVIKMVESGDYDKKESELKTSDESEKVCDNWHCKDGVVQEQYGEKVYCDVCNGTGKLG